GWGHGGVVGSGAEPALVPQRGAEAHARVGAPPEPGALPAAALGAAPAHRRRPRRAGVSPPGRGVGRGVADQAAAVPDARHARASPLLDPVRARGPGHDLEPPAAASDWLP